MITRKWFRWAQLLLAMIAIGTSARHCWGQADILVAEQVSIGLPKFWIGIIGEPISETLMAQLNLKTGLVVAKVVDHSPAETAGLQPHDIILSVQGRDVSKIEELFEPIAQSAGKPISLSVMRAGKITTIEVQPENRPQPEEAFVRRNENNDVLYWSPEAAQRRFAFVNPAIVINGAHEPLKLPNDVNIRIEKSGEASATITVKQGDKTWTVTEDKLDELPEEMRSWVQRLVLPLNMLQVQGAPVGFPPAPNAWFQVHVPTPPLVPQMRPLPGAPMIQPLPPGVVPPARNDPLRAIQQQLDAMNQQIQDLKAELEKSRTQAE